MDLLADISPLLLSSNFASLRLVPIFAQENELFERLRRHPQANSQPVRGAVFRTDENTADIKVNGLYRHS